MLTVDPATIIAPQHRTLAFAMCGIPSQTTSRNETGWIVTRAAWVVQGTIIIEAQYYYYYYYYLEQG
jgi:hypothetical protein